MKILAAIRAALEEGGGVFKVSSFGTRRSSVWRVREQANLVTVLPGIMCEKGNENNWIVYLRAFALWKPNAVITGQVAWLLATNWLPVYREGHETVDAYVPCQTRSKKGFRWHRRAVPRDQICTLHGIKFTSPLYSAMLLSNVDEGKSLCDGLRERWFSTHDLEPLQSCFKGLRGTPERIPIIRATLLNPYSYLERQAQKKLIKAQITGWVANATLRIAGQKFIPDILFEDEKLIIELDGHKYHSSPEQIDQRNRRDALLSAAGYRVIHFSYHQIMHQWDWCLQIIRAALSCSEPIAA